VVESSRLLDRVLAPGHLSPTVVSSLYVRFWPTLRYFGFRQQTRFASPESLTRPLSTPGAPPPRETLDGLSGRRAWLGAFIERLLSTIPPFRKGSLFVDRPRHPSTVAYVYDSLSFFRWLIYCPPNIALPVPTEFRPVFSSPSELTDPLRPGLSSPFVAFLAYPCNFPMCVR